MVPLVAVAGLGNAPYSFARKERVARDDSSEPNDGVDGEYGSCKSSVVSDPCCVEERTGVCIVSTQPTGTLRTGVARDAPTTSDGGSPAGPGSTVPYRASTRHLPRIPTELEMRTRASAGGGVRARTKD